eukprot:TRINITY_DN19095_c0_g1_i2.p1 TRINITY_DN19095_c0_g1~~TRINITY_DN19095_c0_g1_i2.p1  ORF type:complete len:395 (+),score=48.27 TRINITY_DN19095_c0_g1_i2:102-1286(+)
MALLSALGHLSTVGTFWEIGQGQVHQRQNVRWARRGYTLDVQALKIDLLAAARDDVRGTHQTYIGQLDTLLLLNGLLLPFALSTLQFSDEFVPKDVDQCQDCFEVVNNWLVTIWVYIIAATVALPFWSLLLLLRCKIWLDTWLQNTLDEIQEQRRDILSPPTGPTLSEINENAAAGQEELVVNLGAFIVYHQDQFAECWNGHCRPLVRLAMRLLIAGCCVCVILVALMFWIYLVNRDGVSQPAHGHFLFVMAVGLLCPALWFLRERRRDRAWKARASALHLDSMDFCSAVDPDSFAMWTAPGQAPIDRSSNSLSSLRSERLFAGNPPSREISLRSITGSFPAGSRIPLQSFSAASSSSLVPPTSTPPPTRTTTSPRAPSGGPSLGVVSPSRQTS